MLTRFGLWLRALLTRGRIDREMREEIDSHLARRIADLEADGLSAADARRAAHLEFGGVAAVHEAGRDARGVQDLASVAADARYALRAYARTPAATLTMIVVFALGIGANAAVYLLIRSMTSGPPTGMAPHASMVRIRGIDRSGPRAIGREFSYPEYRAYAEQDELFSDVAAWTSLDASIDVGQTSPDVHIGAVTFVTAGYFPVLGLTPALGPGLPAGAPDEAEHPPLVGVISDLLWTRHFARSPDVRGRTLVVNGVTIAIAGVAPPRFAGARSGGSAMRVWVPLSARRVLQPSAATLQNRDAAVFGLVARVQPGIDAERATPRVQQIAITEAARAAAGSRARNVSADVVPLYATNYFPPSGESSDDSGIGPIIASTMGPFLLLAIPCTTVSAMLAGRAIARRKEIAVRLALGAPRRRIVRQLLTESVILAFVAGALSLFVLWGVLRLFTIGITEGEILIDWRAVGLTFGLATVAGVIFGLSPALHATRQSCADALKDSSATPIGSRLRLQSLLVVVQIALTQPALLSMGMAFVEVTEDRGRVPVHLADDRVLELQFNANPRYGALDADAVMHIGARVGEMPGVVGVVPLDTNADYYEIRVHPDDRAADVAPPERAAITTTGASAGFFEMAGVRFTRGRDFDASDRARQGPLIISANLARRLWGATDPIGRRVIGERMPNRAETTFEIVGVIDDRARAEQDEQEARAYVPRVHTPGRLLVRTATPADAMIPAVRAAAANAAPGMPITRVETRRTVQDAERQQFAMQMTALGAVGGLALVLGAIGLYAVVAVSVGQRVKEIGIRTALGADRRRIVRLFVGRGLRIAVAGLVVGLTLALVVARFLAASRGEPMPATAFPISLLIAVIVTAVALVASWLPSRRAARVDPMRVLGSE